MDGPLKTGSKNMAVIENPLDYKTGPKQHQSKWEAFLTLAMVLTGLPLHSF